MKINIYETVEVNDTQRVQIADLIDKKVSKRIATRDEMKAFIWEEGQYWDQSLEALHRNFTKGGDDDDEEEAAPADEFADPAVTPSELDELVGAEPNDSVGDADDDEPADDDLI